MSLIHLLWTQRKPLRNPLLKPLRTWTCETLKQTLTCNPTRRTLPEIIKGQPSKWTWNLVANWTILRQWFFWVKCQTVFLFTCLNRRLARQATLLLQSPWISSICCVLMLAKYFLFFFFSFFLNSHKILSAVRQMEVFNTLWKAQRLTYICSVLFSVQYADPKPALIKCKMSRLLPLPPRVCLHPCITTEESSHDHEAKMKLKRNNNNGWVKWHF